MIDVSKGRAAYPASFPIIIKYKSYESFMGSGFYSKRVALIQHADEFEEFVDTYILYFSRIYTIDAGYPKTFENFSNAYMLGNIYEKLTTIMDASMIGIEIIEITNEKHDWRKVLAL